MFTGSVEARIGSAALMVLAGVGYLGGIPSSQADARPATMPPDDGVQRLYHRPDELTARCSQRLPAGYGGGGPDDLHTVSGTLDR